MRYVGVGAVWVYRFTLAPFLGVGQCKYHPSCSQYAIDAYKEFGLFKGTVLAGLAAAALQSLEPRRRRLRA